MNFYSFYVALFFIASSLLAMEEQAIIITPSAKAYQGPLQNVESYQESAVVIIYGKRYLQVDEFLFNETVNSRAITNMPFYRDVHQGEIVPFGGIVEKNQLEKMPSYHEDRQNYIVVEPVAEIDKGARSIQVSMGTKLGLEGELRGRFGVRLADNTYGWIDKNAVKPLYERMSGRNALLLQARKLIDQPYKWGGRSALEGGGYDCSGLVKTVFMTYGIELPHPVELQRQKARLIGHQALLPGDVILSVNNHNKAVHVVIWTGEGTVIEASPISMTVREAPINEVFGVGFDAIKNGQVFYTDAKGMDYSVRFGRFIQ